MTDAAAPAETERQKRLRAHLERLDAVEDEENIPEGERASVTQIIPWLRSRPARTEGNPPEVGGADKMPSASLADGGEQEVEADEPGVTTQLADGGEQEVEAVDPGVTTQLADGGRLHVEAVDPGVTTQLADECRSRVHRKHRTARQCGELESRETGASHATHVLPRIAKD